MVGNYRGLEIFLSTNAKTRQLTLLTKTLSLLCFEFSTTWPMSRNQYLDLCCELHLYFLSQPVNHIYWLA